uniref:Uncharacterized protein n=1 Tax=Pseudomonas phage RVTF4 TaxID=3236931 RepID=A0AB39CCF4_9VIRU
MTQMKIDLGGKTTHFVKALEKLIEKNKVNGIFCELAYPDLSPYKDASRKIWRVGQTNPTLIGAVLKHVATTDKEVLFDVFPSGPRRDFFQMERARGLEYGIGIRQVVNASGKVLSIGSLDMVALDQFGEVEPLVVEKLV